MGRFSFDHICMEKARYKFLIIIIIGWIMIWADGGVDGWMDGSSRAFHKFLEIFEKVSGNFSKRCSKVAFGNES